MRYSTAKMIDAKRSAAKIERRISEKSSSATLIKNSCRTG
jgi:hypothetical protein